MAAFHHPGLLRSPGRLPGFSLSEKSLLSQLLRARMLRNLDLFQPRRIFMRAITILALTAFLSLTIAESFTPAYAAARGAMSGKGDYATSSLSD
jgi:hypothetical protein